MSQTPQVRAPALDDRAAVVLRIRRSANEYVGDTGASAAVFVEIEQLLEWCGTQLIPPGAAMNVIRSKCAPIEKHQILEYWLFDGLPLSTRVVFYFGVLEGFFRLEDEQQSRWDEFAGHMEEFRAREAALHVSRDVGGWLFGGEPEALWDLGKRAASLPGHYCELGAWLGRSTLIWCHTLRQFAPSKTLFVVDNWHWGSEGEKYPFMTEGRDIFLEFTLNLAGFEKQYQPHKGLIADVLPTIRPQLETEGLALLFHDAGHTYAEVKNDLARCVPFLNEGAYLAVHDFNHPEFPEVRDAVTAVQLDVGYLTLEATVNTLGVFRRTTC